MPKFYKSRPVPFALKPKIENEIKRFIENKVLIPTKGATLIVPILKPNGGLRICGDFKVTLNPYLKIQWNIFTAASRKKFSKIDFSETSANIIN